MIMEYLLKTYKDIFVKKEIANVNGNVQMNVKVQIPIIVFAIMVFTIVMSAISITYYIAAPYKMHNDYLIDVTAPRDYVNSLDKANAIKNDDSVFKTGIPVVIGTAVSLENGELILIKKSKVDTLLKFFINEDQIPKIDYTKGYVFTTNSIMSYKSLLYADLINNEFDVYKISRDVPKLRQREQLIVGNILVKNIDGSHYARTTKGVIMAHHKDPELDRLIGKTKLIEEFLVKRKAINIFN